MLFKCSHRPQHTIYHVVLPSMNVCTQLVVDLWRKEKMFKREKNFLSKGSYEVAICFSMKSYEIFWRQMTKFVIVFINILIFLIYLF